MSTRPGELYDLFAEETVIGAVLLDPRGALAFPEVARLRAGQFANSRLADVWRIIRELEAAGQLINPFVILDCAQDLGISDLDHAFLLPLIEQVRSFTDAAPAARVIAKFARQRSLERAGHLYAGAAYAKDADRRAELLARADLERHAAVARNGHIHTARNLVASAKPAPPDIVAGFLPAEAAVLFAGPGGDGKSFAMLDLAICVAVGKPWLGLEVTQTPVLIVDLENRQLRLTHRLDRTCRGHALLEPPAELSVTFGVEARLDCTDGVLELQTLARQVGARLLVLDSLVDFLGDLDENSNSEMAGLAERLRDLSARIGGTVVAIDHTPKTGGGPRGASAKRDNTDVSISVTRDGNILTMRQTKNRTGPEQTITARLNWGVATFNLSPLGHEIGRAARVADEDEAAILQYIRESGGRALSSDVTNAVMDKSEHARTTVHRKLRGLIDDQVLERQEQGPGLPYWVVSTDGAE